MRVKRRLRQQSTDAETKLWLALRDRRLGGFKFVRQAAVLSYIVDFLCREQKLIVEVDGGQHAENADDLRRDAALDADGYRVLRFWNSDVLRNKEGVLTTILASLQRGALAATPSVSTGEEIAELLKKQSSWGEGVKRWRSPGSI